MMKKTIFPTITVIIFMLGHGLNVYATPPGFENCGQGMYSLKYLKSISKDELVEDYCACINLAELGEKQLVNNSKGRANLNANSWARRNASKVARILKRNHQHPEAPKCAIK